VLELIDESLESFFRASVPLSATDVDVAFDAPDREWSAKLTRPDFLTGFLFKFLFETFIKRYGNIRLRGLDI